MDDASRSSAAKAGQRSTDSSPARSSAPSPNSASATGASMPAAACEEPPVAGSASRSSTVTVRPRWRARRGDGEADDAPADDDDVAGVVVVWQLGSHCAGMIRKLVTVGASSRPLSPWAPVVL